MCACTNAFGCARRDDVEQQGRRRSRLCASPHNEDLCDRGEPSSQEQGISYSRPGHRSPLGLDVDFKLGLTVCHRRVNSCWIRWTVSRLRSVLKTPRPSAFRGTLPKGSSTACYVHTVSSPNGEHS